MSNVARVMHAWCSFAPCRLSFNTRNYAMHRFSTGTTQCILFVLLHSINTRVSSMTGPNSFFSFSLSQILSMYFITLLVSALYSHSRLRIWSRETVSAVPSRVSILFVFILIFPTFESCILLYCLFQHFILVRA